jgi:Zn-dependent metalloprotease
MKKIWPLVVLLPTFLFAQKADENYAPVQYKNATCNSSFIKVRLEGPNNAASVQQYLLRTLNNLKDYRAGVKLNYVKESPGAFHYSFTQTFGGIEVYQSEIKVNVDRNSVIRSVFDNSENTSDWNLNLPTAGSNYIIALMPGTSTPVLCNRTIEKKLEVLRANGEIVFSRDMNAYVLQDTMVSGKVFNPDPITTAQTVYGPPYYDHGDTTNAQLDAQRQTVNFMAGFNGANFVLENRYVRVADFDQPTAAPATSNDGHFDFDRSQSGFEDVNAFYHINTMRSHIHALGFYCADTLVEIDAHAVSNADNSYFSPISNPQRIHYGTGNVDDAEDADVCVHEYGHFVAECAAPGSNSGSQRNALDEGFGDYLAGSYSNSLSTYQNTWIFNWDGHNPFWNGRVLDANWVYPTDLNASIYHNGQIWSATLWCIHNTIGRAATDSIILQAHYMYAQNISMQDAAQLLLDADTLLTGGKYSCAIYNCEFQHGLNPVNPLINCTIGILENEQLPVQFIAQSSSFTLQNLNGGKVEVLLLNSAGQLITSLDENQPTWNYSNINLPSGVYLVNVKLNGAGKTFKWVKL